MSLYTITIHDRLTGLEIADISRLCTKRHYVMTRNRSGMIDLELDLLAAEDFAVELGMGFYGLFNPGYSEIRVTRGTRPMMGGRLLEVTPSLSAEGDALQLTALGYLEMLTDRHVFPDDTLTYTNEDIGQIAWNRINDTQNREDGDLGITMGEIEPSRNIEEEDQAPFGKTVKELLIGYTDLSNSGDFEFTADKQFTWHYPGLGTDRPDNPFRYGDGGNIRSITAPRDASNMVNVSINRGANNGTAQVFSIRQNTAAREAYGRHERVDDYSSIQSEELIQDFGDETLRTASSPSTLPTIELFGDRDPILGVYGLGDRVPLEIPDRPSFAHIHGQYLRINEIDVTVDANDHEDVSIEASIA
jgi:hypothetical protein